MLLGKTRSYKFHSKFYFSVTHQNALLNLFLIRTTVNHFYLIHCVKSAQIRSFFWSVFSRIRTEYGEIGVMRENTDPKKLHIWTLFTQWYLCWPHCGYNFAKLHVVWMAKVSTSWLRTQSGLSPHFWWACYCNPLAVSVIYVNFVMSFDV